MSTVSPAAAGGALLWCAIAVLAWTGRSQLGLIETLFLLAPLVHVQLGFGVVRGLLGEPSALGRLAHSLLPIAGGLAAVSFWLPSGPLAGGLALAWPVVCATAGLGGFGRVARRTGSVLERVLLTAALFYLVVGGVWLVLSRAGITPMQLPRQIVLLASVHFHFTGFILPVFAAATHRASGTSRQPPTGVGRVVFPLLAAGIIGGPLCLAAGNLLLVPVLKLAGALLLTLSSFALVWKLVPVLRTVRSAPGRVLLGVAGASLVVGMTLVGVYTVGEFTERFWLVLPDMARFHGTVNGLGFALCGLLGWTLALGRGRTQVGS